MAAVVEWAHLLIKYWRSALNYKLQQTSELTQNNHRCYSNSSFRHSLWKLLISAKIERSIEDRRVQRIAFWSFEPDSTAIFGKNNFSYNRYHTEISSKAYTLEAHLIITLEIFDLNLLYWLLVDSKTFYVLPLPSHVGSSVFGSCVSLRNWSCVFLLKRNVQNFYNQQF